MQKMKRRGFTIVELVIVIAVVAILAAVLIPTFANLVKKAKVSNDTSLIRNLNTALVLEETGFNRNITMGDAIADAEKNGYSIERLTSGSENDLVWDEVNNRFALFSKEGDLIAGEDTSKSTPKSKLWKIVKNSAEAVKGGYSYYLADNFQLGGATELEFNTSVDTGENTFPIKYVSDEKKDVKIRTNNAEVALTIVDNSEGSTINHYGKLCQLSIEKTGYDCYYENGISGYVTVDEGMVVVCRDGSIELLHATTDKVAVRIDGGEVINAYREGNAASLNAFSEARGGTPDLFKQKTAEEIEAQGQRAKNFAISHVAVKGIAGFEDTEFESMQDAFVNIQPTIEELAGLEQNTATNEAFDAVFTDGGKVTWEIYGKQTIANPLVLSFGREAIYYNPERWFDTFEVVGMNRFAELVFEENITLPRNWWTYETDPIQVDFKNLTLTEKAGGQISIGQANAYGIVVNFDKCTVNGNIYMYHNNVLDMTIKDTKFVSQNDSYALMFQGEHPGRIVIDGCRFFDYSRGVNFQRNQTDFVLRNCLFESGRAEPDRGVVQLTDGKSFVVDNNTINVNRGNAFWFHEAVTNAETSYQITNNKVQAAYLANTDAKFNVNDKITSSGNTFGTTDTKNCMEKEATVATPSEVTAIK